jgi:SPOR domain
VTTVVTAPPEVDGGSQEAVDALAGGGDPFAAHALADNDPQVGAVPSPDGSRDPFAPSRSASAPPPAASPSSSAPASTPPTLPNQIVVGTPKAGAVAKPGWIVVLASIQTRLGRNYAERFASRVRNNGLEVEVLDSSTRKPLRAGYYVVYTGPYATLGAVQRAAAHVHAFGYRTAYIRQILRY